MSGWVKLHKSLLDWEWYSDINATRLLIHLLLSVNYKDKKWKGNLIKSGSMVFSWDTLCDKTGLTKQQCRTAMSKLERSGEVTRKSTNKYQLLSLVKWDKLQKKEDSLTGGLTDQQQSNNNQITPTKEDNNINNIKINTCVEEEFLIEWANARMHYDNQETNIKLNYFERQSFNNLSKEYSKEDFRKAIAGLFFQNTLPALRVRPKWILERSNFETMLDCWNNQNKIYKGDSKKQYSHLPQVSNVSYKDLMNQ